MLMCCEHLVEKAHLTRDAEPQCGGREVGKFCVSRIHGNFVNLSCLQKNGEFCNEYVFPENKTNNSHQT